MVGIPEADLAEWRARRGNRQGNGQGASKRPKIEKVALTPEQLKAQLEAHKALMSGKAPPPSAAPSLNPAFPPPPGNLMGYPTGLYAKMRLLMTRFMTPTTKQSLSRNRTFFCSAHRADTLSIRLLTFSLSLLTSARRSDRLFCRRTAPSPPPLSSCRSTRWRTFSEACLSFLSSKSMSRRGAPDRKVCMRSVNVEVGYEVGISKGCPSMS